MDDIVDVNTLFGPLPSASSDLNVDALLELMTRHGVQRAYTLSTLGMLLDSAAGNAATRAACSEHAELLPVGTLNPTAFMGDLGGLESLAAERCCLLRFFPEYQGWPVSYVPFHALVRAAAQHRMPLAIGSLRPGEITSLIAVLDDYPAPVILTGVELPTLAEAIAALRERANWFVETSRLLQCGAIAAIARAVGPERLLFGTAAPARPVASALNALRFSGLGADEIRMVAAGNAREVLHLSAR